MRVRIFGTLRQTVAAKDVEVRLQARDTVGSVLERLATEYPALGKRLLDEEGNPRNSVHVLVNGRSIQFLDGLNTPIQEGDRLSLFPAVGGG
jgi:MoaD family protein